MQSAMWDPATFSSTPAPDVEILSFGRQTLGPLAQKKSTHDTKRKANALSHEEETATSRECTVTSASRLRIVFGVWGDSGMNSRSAQIQRIKIKVQQSRCLSDIFFCFECTKGERSDHGLKHFVTRNGTIAHCEGSRLTWLSYLLFYFINW